MLHEPGKTLAITLAADPGAIAGDTDGRSSGDSIRDNFAVSKNAGSLDEYSIASVSLVVPLNVCWVGNSEGAASPCL